MMTAVSAAKTVPRAVPPTPGKLSRIRDSRLLCQVVTGSDLQGGGVFSFIKAKGTPQNRAIIASVFVALGTLVANPSIVTALTADASINSDI